MKVRANRAEEVRDWRLHPEFFDSILVGFYVKSELRYAAKIRAGFTPASRRSLFSLLSKISLPDCPFSNLPEKGRGRWGEGLTAEDMKQCRWVKPVLLATIEFLQWTPDNKLRHPRFAGVSL